MDDGESTALRPRQVRTVARLRAAVVQGRDAGRSAAPAAGGPLTVGTAHDNVLVLTDPAVSRYHLELRRAADGIQIDDLGSRNGTFLGAVRVRSAVVPPGTHVRVGDLLLAVEDGGAAVADEDAAPVVPGLVGASPAIREIARLVHRLAGVTSSVLVEGETGVGKEVVARAIHELGPRRAGPFVVLDCASMPATLVAAQLFGHERGAFTGADQRRPGAFERAHGGTLLLDEIGELPLEVQPALLGVLERRRFARVGGGDEVAVDVRVLAATNRDLRAEVNQGGFRADLYHRLAVARIVIPPLRERPEDVAPLAAHFAEMLTGLPGENPLAGALATLVRHRWSGNARELRNVVEAAIVMGRVSLDGGPAAPPAPAGGEAIEPYREARARVLAQFEHAYFRRLLEQCQGNASEAARRARMDRPYLLTLLKRLGLR